MQIQLIYIKYKRKILKINYNNLSLTYYEVKKNN